jgi:neutral amino acid transport system ATP-binding protein
MTAEEQKSRGAKKGSALNLPLLAASGLTKSFGGIKAVDNAQIEVAKGSITGLIGTEWCG